MSLSAGTSSTRRRVWALEKPPQFMQFSCAVMRPASLKRVGDLAQAVEAFLFVLIFPPWLLSVGHDADNLSAELLHAWDGSIHFVKCEGKVTFDTFRPAADQGAELCDADASVFKLAAGRVEFRVAQIMDIFAIDAACRNILPAQFLGGFDLGREIGRCFVGKSCEFHAVLINTCRLLPKFRFFQS